MKTLILNCVDDSVVDSVETNKETENQNVIKLRPKDLLKGEYRKQLEGMLELRICSGNFYMSDFLRELITHIIIYNPNSQINSETVRKYYYMNKTIIEECTTL